MAENENGQERTEQPTPKRLDDARKRGQLPRSTDLNATAVVLGAGAGLYLLGGQLGGSLHEVTRSALTLSRDQATNESLMTEMLSNALLQALLALAPLLGLTLAIALLAPMAIGGWNISTEALAPDFKRLNPISGFKRMFSARNIVELAKAFAKFGVLAAIAVLFLSSKSGELLALGRETTDGAILHAFGLTGQALLAFGLGLMLIAAVDAPWQLWQHHRRLRMSRQEIREEIKESDGSPEVKGRIRSLQQEMAKRRMMQDVPLADVVVVNPTHYSVALRYDEKRMRAPVVVAKGVDVLAARIREVATEHGVPIFEAPPLARALYRSVDIGGEIPANLYVAVAQVLTYVYQLRTARQSGGPAPEPPGVELPTDPTRH